MYLSSCYQSNPQPQCIAEYTVVIYRTSLLLYCLLCCTTVLVVLYYSLLNCPHPIAPVAVLRLLLAVDVDGEDGVGAGGVLVHVVVADGAVLKTWVNA